MIRLWMATLLLAVPAAGAPTLAFGRLEHTPSRCQIVANGRPLDCQRLQITANGSSGLRLRFIGDDEETGGSYQLSFISLEGDQGSPLSCDRSGCRLEQSRWSASLLSTAWVRFDARGLPTGLPIARTASGRCWIDAETVSCESHSRNAHAMSAEAQL
ncbi:hypothetical protein KR52_00370 [Synechococcus sp. KORDI-52]|uniref:hypothetical protein n=1 Tax=Synechococcus sp. KORDI-52 TaxID=585425 RepID=UPI0004E08679|nr:hypothetical protein [Synechococcus sp. KORDI-52]AII47650.1 hypothetical protein KR52_00370 [Synechococcus sp. KORDI-52]